MYLQRCKLRSGMGGVSQGCVEKKGADLCAAATAGMGCLRTPGHQCTVAVCACGRLALQHPAKCHKHVMQQNCNQTSIVCMSKMKEAPSLLLFQYYRQVQESQPLCVFLGAYLDACVVSMIIGSKDLLYQLHDIGMHVCCVYMLVYKRSNSKVCTTGAAEDVQKEEAE